MLVVHKISFLTLINTIMVESYLRWESDTGSFHNTHLGVQRGRHCQPVSVSSHIEISMGEILDFNKILRK